MAILKLVAVVVDCADANPMVAFYEAAFGAERLPENDTYVRMGEVIVIFRQVADYRPPTWGAAEVPMQMHLDFSVEDMAEAERLLVEYGATVPEFQPHRAQNLVVLLDPAGHPFCIAPPL